MRNYDLKLTFNLNYLHTKTVFAGVMTPSMKNEHLTFILRDPRYKGILVVRANCPSPDRALTPRIYCISFFV